MDLMMIFSAEKILGCKVHSSHSSANLSLVPLNSCRDRRRFAGAIRYPPTYDNLQASRDPNLYWPNDASGRRLGATPSLTQVVNRIDSTKVNLAAQRFDAAETK